ncbi:MAG TPA: hypothetical protein VFG81_01040 [Anaerolineales bacterium]|jgi:hypothetical protein|nr:hypothetical protein [Anaerolineales bacterium]
MEYSTTQQRIAAIGYQPVLKKSTFVIALAIFGVFSILAGMISLATWVTLSSGAVMPGLAEAMLTDAVYEFALGALLFASSRAFAKGRILAVWLYAASILLDVLYNILTGNPLNYLFIGFGLLLIWQILKFKDRLDLA